MKETDILKDIPSDELHLLINLLKSRIGRADSTFMVNFIKNAIDWITRFPDNSYVTVMAPNGDWKSHCSFVGDIQMPNQAAMVIFSLEESNNELTNALLLTKRIDWNRAVVFAMVPDHNYPIVYKLAKELNLKLEEDNPPCYMYRIDSEDALNFDCSCPENTRIDKLKMNHAQIVNDEWPHKSEGSEKSMEAIISRNDSVGLFVGDNGELASWTFISCLGALASLQTMPQHKRKGYGKVTTKAMAIKMASKGLDPYGTVFTHNTASRKLFDSLGFKRQSQEGKFIVSHGRTLK